MQICRERYLISRSHVAYPSKSDPTKKPYKVYAFRDGEFPMCTCYPFLTGRVKKAKQLGVPVAEVEHTCSHIKKLLGNVCDWKQETEDDYQWDQRCPKCGEGLVNTDDIDLPDDREGQIEDLRNLLKSLDAGDDDDLQPGDATDSEAASKLLDLMKGTP